MVKNHREVETGKTRMVINDRLKQLEFDGYFIPRKDVLVSQTKGSKFFSNSYVIVAIHVVVNR